MRCAGIVVIAPVALALVALAAMVTMGAPRHVAGLGARSVCSAVFVAGRDAERVFDDDVRPASFALALMTIEVDHARKQVHARFVGGFERQARYLGQRGCVLDADDDASAVDVPPLPMSRRDPWPAGNAPLSQAQWGPQVDPARLAAVVDAAFVGAGDSTGANARAVAVVHRNRLLVDRQAPGFDADTRMQGWSMAKTVTAMLAHQLEGQGAFAGRARVVDAVAGRSEPAWASAWRGDARAQIRVDDLLWMRAGLANDESYTPWGEASRMLFGRRDVAGHAASAPADAPPGTRWRYSSAATNILAQVMRTRFDGDDVRYWNWPSHALFGPIGAHSAMFETDAVGTWIGSSYLWASSADWARLGQLLLDDGRWQGRQVLAPGFLARASTPATSAGDGRGYGAQTWRIGAPEAGSCAGQVPSDTLAMLGHWGQIVAVVPSRQAVIVRLGWTFDRERFDPCAFVADVLSALGDDAPRALSAP